MRGKTREGGTQGEQGKGRRRGEEKRKETYVHLSGVVRFVQSTCNNDDHRYEFHWLNSRHA